MGALRNPKKTTWSDLAEHLVEKILENLPVECFFRFKTVCKTWNSLFSSQHLESIARNKQPFLILCPSNTQLPTLIYSFHTQTWRTISLSFIPHDGHINFTGSSSALLLADITADFFFAYSSPRLCVCNPLSQKFFILPQMTSVGGIMAKAILPGGRNDMEEYRVMVVGKSSSGEVVVEAYDSTTMVWEIAGTIPSGVVIRNESLFFFNGYLLGMTASINGGIMVHNIEHGTTKVVGLPAAEGHFLWVRLVCCKNGVFLVGAMEEYESFKGLVVWGLDCGEMGKWEEIWKMGSCVFEELRKRWNSDWFECVGVGDKICFRAHECMEIGVFDVTTLSWNWLPNFCSDMRYVSMRSFPLQISPSPKLF